MPRLSRPRRRAAARQPESRGPSFVLSCVDSPKPGERLHPGGTLSGKGWAISESPIAAIAVHLGETFLCYANYGQPRPEIGREFGHYPQAHHSGFIFSTRLSPELEQARGTDLHLRFRTEDGSESRRHVRLDWADTPPAEESAGRAWPIRAAIDECRVDPSGQLRLRGWAIARREITSLDLYLNDTRLHAAERGLDRPDIGQRHPSYPGAAQAGFRLVQQLDTAPAETDTIRLVVRAAGLQRQVIVPITPPEAQPRLLQAGAVSLCCETLRQTAQGLSIAGWAVGDAETREIEIRAGEVSLGTAELGLPRPDIGNRFPRLPGARFAGWRFTAATSGSATLTLILRDSAGGERRMELPLPGTEAAQAETIHAGVDHPALREGLATRPIRGRLAIGGWAVCPSGIERIEIHADDVPLGEATTGIRREDIGAAYPELPEALTGGFALSVPHRLLGDGEHTLQVLIHARSGATTQITFRVTLEADDDSRVGLPRRSVPHGQTSLRLALLARFGAPPAVTILIRRASGAEPRALAATLESLRRQTLADWRALVLVHDEAERAAAEALFAAEPALAGRARCAPASTDTLWPGPADSARFDLLCLLRAGDRLGADALIELAVECRLSDAEFVYADERCIDPARDSLHPFLKPGWSPELLLGFNYIGRAWCVTRALAERAGITPREIDRFGEYDAVLRLTETAQGIAHLPLSLAERHGKRIDPPAREQEALTRALARRGIAATLHPGRAPATWRVQRAVAPALVSVIIPTCGARGLVRRAIATLRASTPGLAIEIVVIDDVKPDQPALKAWLRQHADRVLQADGPFNWSRVNNAGARAAQGAFLLFLNDDTEFRDPHWLPALLEHAQRPEVGAVGPQLLYPDGKVQHAGMFLRHADGIHAFRFAPGDDPGPFGLALTTREVTAVTGACLLVRRAVFEALGGFDESHGVIKNDLDFCLRLGMAGLAVIYTPHASLLHHEMASRAPLPDSFDAARFDGSWGLLQLRGDPLLNPNLSAESEDFAPETEPVEFVQAGHPLIDRAAVREILVVKLDHIGDFICALPAIERLRTAFPAARITLLAGAAVGALAALSPSVDAVEIFDFFAALSIAGRRAISEADYEALAARLRPRNFDIAVDLRMHAETRHVLRYSGAALYAGFDHGGHFPWLQIAQEWEGDLRLADKRAHVADSLLRLAAAIDDAARIPIAPLRLDPGPAARHALPPAFAGRMLICIHPGAGTLLKQWPPSAYAGLIRLLLDAHDATIVLVGATEEAAIAAEVAALVARPDAVISLAGQIGLTELAGLLCGCALFVGNDSGPKHLAGALGVATVGVHAAHVDAAEWAPLGPRAIAVRRRMSCGPCYIAEESDCPRGVACLRGIAPAQVYRACRLLLGFARTGSPDPAEGTGSAGG